MTSTTPTGSPQLKIGVHAAANDDDEDDTVDSIEACFLKGLFREALTRANRFLDHHRRADPQGRPCSFGEDPSRAILQTRMDLGDTDLVRTIWVRWADQDRTNDGDDDNATDRVAAVALQSWYEVSRLVLLEEEGPTRNHPRRSTSISSHHQKDNGHRYLQPFLDTYTSTSTTTDAVDPNQKVVRQHPPPFREMSLELLVIWIQFCRSALQQMPVATSWTLQFLRHVRHNVAAAANARTSAAEELLVRLMVDLLPRHYTQVEPLLEYLQAESPSLSLDELDAWCASGNVLVSEGDTGDAPALGNHKHVIQQCLRFCNTDEGNWPESFRDSFGDCRVQLQAMLQDIYRQRNMEQSRIQCPGRDGDQRPGTDGPFTVVDHDPKPDSTPARLILSKDYRFSLSNWKVALVQWLRWIRQEKHAWTSAPPWHSIMALVPTRKQTLSMALLLLALAYGWRRHGQRLRRAVGRDAVTHVLGKLVQEILQAVGVNV